MTSTHTAHQYMRTQMAAQGTRPYKEGWFVEARRFLLEHATDQINRGITPNVPLEESRIAMWCREVQTKGWWSGYFAGDLFAGVPGR